jgi:hypothetical protein
MAQSSMRFSGTFSNTPLYSATPAQGTVSNHAGQLNTSMCFSYPLPTQPHQLTCSSPASCTLPFTFTWCT